MSSVNNRHGKSASMIAMPFVTVATSSMMVKAATSPTNEHAKAETAKSQAQQVAASSNAPTLTIYRVADRVHSHYYGDLKVSFYQYFRENRIVAISRRNGFATEKVLTPEVAYACDVSFDINGAIAWIRQTGFKDAGLNRYKEVPPWEEYPEEVKARQPEPPPPQLPKKRAPPAVVRAQSEGGEIVPPPANKARPFTGRIVELGESERPGRDGKPPFKTYAIKLRDESSSYEKEFLGEHLGELAVEHGLCRGNLVTLRLLGRQIFTVTIGDKTEERTRNTYAIEVIR